MHRVQAFFLFCSGANLSVLNRTPTEVNKYVGIGATIFFTGLFAFVAGAYAIFTVFNSYFLALIFGLLWGLMIFNLDRYIVSTIKKKGNFFRDAFHAMPRIALAVLIAMVIAKPLELKIFDSEIQSELVLMQQEQYLEQESAVRRRFEDDIAAVKRDIARLQQEIDEKSVHRDSRIMEAMAEADGTGGSQIRNMGPIYRAKKLEAEKAEAEFIILADKNNKSIQERQVMLSSLEAKRSSELNQLAKVRLTGFAARMEALERVAARSDIIYYAGIFIMLLFIAIETAPIFVKLISARSPYDFVLDKHEHAFAMNHKSITSSLSSVTKNEIAFLINTNAHKTDLAIKAEKELSDRAIKEHVERLKEKPMMWRELLRRGKLYGLE